MRLVKIEFKDDYDELKQKVYEKAHEKELSTAWSFTEREDAVWVDEFGRTDAPTVITDSFKYITEERLSVFDIPHKQRAKKVRSLLSYSLKQVHPNPTLVIQIRKDIVKRTVLEKLINDQSFIDSNQLFLKNFKEKDIHEAAYEYLKFTETPCNATFKSWQHYKNRSDKKVLIRRIFEIIFKYQKQIKTTWEI